MGLARGHHRALTRRGRAILRAGRPSAPRVVERPRCSHRYHGACSHGTFFRSFCRRSDALRAVPRSGGRLGGMDRAKKKKTRHFWLGIDVVSLTRRAKSSSGFEVGSSCSYGSLRFGLGIYWQDPLCEGETLRTTLLTCHSWRAGPLSLGIIGPLALSISFS